MTQAGQLIELTSISENNKDTARSSVVEEWRRRGEHFKLGEKNYHGTRVTGMFNIRYTVCGGTNSDYYLELINQTKKSNVCKL